MLEMLKQCTVYLNCNSSTENTRNRKCSEVCVVLGKNSEKVNMISLNVRGDSSRSSGCNVVLCMNIYVVVYTGIEMCSERKAMDKLWLYIK
jgi:hypothetical protein